MTYSNSNIDDLIVRYLTGETDSDENQMLSKWLKESSENLSYFNALRNVWLASSQIQPPLSRKLFSRTKNDVPSVIESETQQSRPGFQFNPILKIAAILMVAVLSAALVFKLLSNDSKFNNSLITVEAMLGSRAVTTLPDGTRVWLNSGSKLQYDAAYNNTKREVKLVGEAYFSVITNAEKPFIVKADKLSIKAMGTVFNVKAYPEDKSIVTTLVKGIVIIEGKGVAQNNFSIKMKPKETITYFKDEKSFNSIANKISKTNRLSSSDTKNESLVPMEAVPVTKLEHVNTDFFTSWKDTRWVIDKQKLLDLSRDLERRYNIKIQFASDSIKNFHFSGILENETIEQVMMIMSHTIPLTYKIEKGVINIGEDKYLMKKFYK